MAMTTPMVEKMPPPTMPPTALAKGAGAVRALN